MNPEAAQRAVDDARQALRRLPGLLVAAHAEGYTSLHNPPDAIVGHTRPGSAPPPPGDLAARDAYRWACKDVARGTRELCDVLTRRHVAAVDFDPELLAGLLGGLPSSTRPEARRWRDDGIRCVPSPEPVCALVAHLARQFDTLPQRFGPAVLAEAARYVLRAESVLRDIRGTVPQPATGADRRRPDVEAAVQAKARRSAAS